MDSDPHADQPLYKAGSPIETAAGALILVHGRGGDARNMLALFEGLAFEEFAAIAPQAAANTWYPQSFLAPIEANQPWLDSALSRIDALVAEVVSKGIPYNRLALLGFSQGACLTLEFVARNPRRYGAVMGLTGGLIGPHGTPRDYPGSLEGTPVFLGTSDPDPHVPLTRVEETRQVLQSMGGSVELRSYPGMPHTVNDDEMEACRELLRAMLTS